MSTGRDIRQDILEVATSMFAKRGFDGTSLQEIADEVDVTKASLLYHYSSKGELREEVLEAVFSHWNAVLPQILQAATSGDRRFEALIEAVVSFFREDADRARLIVRETMDRPDQMRLLLDEYLSPWMAILTDYIEKGQEEGLIYPSLTPDAYIVNVIQMLVGGIATSGVFGTLLRADEETDADPTAVQIREMIRLAREALFIDGTPGAGEPEEPSDESQE